MSPDSLGRFGHTFRSPADAGGQSSLPPSAATTAPSSPLADVKFGPRGDRIVRPPGTGTGPGPASAPDRRLRERDAKAAPSSGSARHEAPPHPHAARELCLALDACLATCLELSAGDAIPPFRKAVATCQARLGGPVDDRIVALVIEWLRTRLARAHATAAADPYGLRRVWDLMWSFAVALGGASMPAACVDAFIEKLSLAVGDDHRHSRLELIDRFVYGLWTRPDEHPSSDSPSLDSNRQLACSGATHLGGLIREFVNALLARPDEDARSDSPPLYPDLQPVCVDVLARWALELPDVAVVLDRLRRVYFSRGTQGPQTFSSMAESLALHAGRAHPSRLHQVARQLTAEGYWTTPLHWDDWNSRLDPFVAGAVRCRNPLALAALLSGVFAAQPAADLCRSETSYHGYRCLAAEQLPHVHQAAPIAQLAAGAVLARGLFAARQAVDAIASEPGSEVFPDDSPPLQAQDQAFALHRDLDMAAQCAEDHARQLPQFAAGLRSISPTDGSFSMERGLQAGGDPLGLVVAALPLEGRYDAATALRVLAMAPLLDTVAVADTVMPWLAGEIEPGDVAALHEALLQPPGPMRATSGDAPPKDGKTVASASASASGVGPGGLDDAPPSLAPKAAGGPAHDARMPPGGVFAAVTDVLVWIDAYGRFLDLGPGAPGEPEAMPAAEWARHAAILDQAIALGNRIAAGAYPQAALATAIARFANGTSPGDPSPGLVPDRLRQLRQALSARSPAAHPVRLHLPPAGVLDGLPPQERARVGRVVASLAGPRATAGAQERAAPEPGTDLARRPCA